MIRRAAILGTLLRNERRARGALLDAQFVRLRELVEHAWAHVPGYRDLWGAHGIEPSMLRSPEDFARWPVVDKPTLRRLGAGSFMDERLQGPAGLVRCSTSGSSGVPFDFWFTPAHDQWRKAQYLRPYISTGRRLGDRLLRLSAAAAPRRKWFQRLGLLRETSLEAAAPATQIAATWRDLRPDVVQGYGSTLRTIALHESGRSLPPPRLIYTDSELLTPDTRGLIRQVFGTEPIDVFGSFETDNIGWQCEHRGAHHMAIDCAVIEVVDAQGRPLPAGEGDLVVTVLGNSAMPFIRYNLRDRVSWVAGDCPCGRTLPRMDVTAGRSEDLLRIGDEIRSPMRLLSRFDGIGAAVAEYRIVQLSDEELQVQLVPGPTWSVEIERLIAAWVAAEDPRLRVRVATVAHIARAPSGKFRSFESLIGRAPA